MPNTRLSRPIVLIALLLLPLPGLLWAQALNVRHLTVEQGLSNRWVTSVVQDDQGMVWIGTDSGLNHFDGHSTTVHTPDPDDPDSIASDYIVDLTLHQDQHLWIATGDGVSRYDRNNLRFINHSLRYPMTDGEDDLGIRRLAIDHRSRIWLATWYGLARFDVADSSLRFPWREQEQLPEDIALTLHKDQRGDLWTAFRDIGLIHIDPANDSFEPRTVAGFLDQDAQPEIQSIHSDENRLFLGGPFGVLIINISDWQLIEHYPTGGKANQLQGAFWIMDLLLDRQNRLWVGSEEHLQRIDLDTGTIDLFRHQTARRNSLSANQISALMQDADNLIWIGTEGDGINIYNPLSEAFSTIAKHETPESSNGLADSSVWDVLEDRQGRLWVVSEEALNLVKDDETVAHFHAPSNREPLEHEIGSYYPSALEQDVDGLILVGGDMGVDRFDPEEQRVVGRYRHEPERESSLIDDFIYSLLVDEQQRLWVGTRHGLSLRTDPDSNHFRHFPPGEESGLPDRQINYLGQLADGSVIAGTYTGVYVFDEQAQRFRGTTLQDLGGGRDVRAVTVAALDLPRQQLLVGTSGLGLLSFDWPLENDASPRAHYKVSDGLANDRVWAILPDAQGHFWISTNDGLARFDPATERMVTYTTAAGLPDNEFNEQAYGTASNGDLMLGGIRGLLRFNPEQLNRLTRPVSDRIVLTRLASDGQPITPSRLEQGLTLPFEQTRLSARFALSDFTAPRDHRYRYRLLPLQRDWVDLGDRGEVEFLNLSSGDYRLEVDGRNSRGQWSSEPLAVGWTILPSPWQTPQAYAGYLAIALIVAGAFTWSRLRRRRHRRETMAAIRANRTRLHLALWASGDGLWDWDQSTGLVHRSRLDSESGMDELQPCSLERDRENVLPEDVARLAAAWDALLNGTSEDFELEYRRITEQGVRWVRECGRVVERDELGRALRVSGTFKDISRERETADHARLFGQAFDNTSEAVVILDAHRRVVAVNRAFSGITGFDRQRIIGQSSSFLNSNRHERKFYRRIWQDVHSKGHWTGELWERKANDEPYPCWINISVVRDDNKRVSHYVAVFSDITERKTAEEKLRRLAKFDPLTELPNRSYLKERLEKALSHAEREWQQLAVLFLDLDRFKQINDSLGHNLGDRLLQIVARRLTHCVRKHDTVARISGDEFIILLEDIPDSQAAAHVAEKILESLQTPMQLENNEATISTSIGISVYPNDGADTTILLKNADTAMYHAKSEGRNNFQYYAPEMNASALERLSLENALRQAVARDELLLYYQPRFNVATGEIVGAEALVRWHHPTRGMVSPGEFIPVAEETGLIKVLGDWVMEQAIRALARWEHAYELSDDFRVSVNLSPRQLIHDDLMESVITTLQRHKVNASRLELEITEGVLMDRKGRGVEQLKQLEAIGLCISVDDFGTGYSSMNYLKDLPINVLKIDQSFVRDIERDPQDAAIVNTIIQLAHSLSLRVVAEGVETQGQLDYLKRHDCELVQGFLLAKPMPEAQFCQRLEACPSPSEPV